MMAVRFLLLQSRVSGGRGAEGCHLWPERSAAPYDATPQGARPLTYDRNAAV